MRARWKARGDGMAAPADLALPLALVSRHTQQAFLDLEENQGGKEGLSHCRW